MLGSRTARSFHKGGAVHHEQKCGEEKFKSAEELRDSGDYAPSQRKSEDNDITHDRAGEKQRLTDTPFVGSFHSLKEKVKNEVEQIQENIAQRAQSRNSQFSGGQRDIVSEYGDEVKAMNKKAAKMPVEFQGQDGWAEWNGPPKN